MALLLSIIGLLAPTIVGVGAEAPTDGLNFPFPQGHRPQPFKASVNPQFVEETVQKARLYRPSKALKQYPEWEDGAPPQDVNALAHYWANGYDWFAIQDQINRNFSHYATTVPGSRRYNHPIPLHFIHERSPRGDAIPLILLHGWPSTNLEWSAVIRPLTHPADASDPAFHVVAPDLPGFGFSPAPTYPGMGPREMGDAFDRLMRQLGYGSSYGVGSTDLGWIAAMWMMYDHGDSILGHTADFFIVQPNATDLERFAAGETTHEETAYIKGLQAYQNINAGYSVVQSTRPLSLAFAMTDSPVGFAGWVWQVMEFASDGFKYTMDELITSTMLCWIQGTYQNFRAYKEFMTPAVSAYPKTNVPTGVSQWAWPNGPYPNLKESMIAPREWIERYANVTYFSRHGFGGHFPAISQPGLWVKDVRAFFAQLG